MSEPHEEEQPFVPSLTEANMPSVDHMFNQGMLNVVIDRWTGGPQGLPRERPGVGLFNNLVRLTDKALREYDAARFELNDYIDGRDSRDAQGNPIHYGVRTSPYIRAVDHMENVISAVARGLGCWKQLRHLGFGQSAPRIPTALCTDIYRLRDMIEHGDDRLTKDGDRQSRPRFQPNEPFAIQLENDFAWIGNWKIEYGDLVQVITSMYEFIELIRGVAAAGKDHPQAVTRTTVTFIGDPPSPGQGGMFGSAFLWELSRQSVSH